METKKVGHQFDLLMKSSPLNYITIITHIRMEQNMYINVGIPVTLTH